MSWPPVAKLSIVPRFPFVWSAPGMRTLLGLIATVWAFSVETSPRWRKRDVTGDHVDETFCNFYLREILSALGVTIPEARANETVEWLDAEARRTSAEVGAVGWREVEARDAKAAVDRGGIAVAGWINPQTNELGERRPGHVALVVPSLGQGGVWIAQAGTTNFSRGQLEHGFGLRAVRFFVRLEG